MRTEELIRNTVGAVIGIIVVIAVMIPIFSGL